MLRLLLVLFIIRFPKVEPTPSIAIDPERAQLLKDALGWMTFRKDGVLMDDSELRPLFLDTILEKYATSKMYRTFVIAFQQGVLPRLTLKENDPCDPTYTFEYKDLFNNSVTWYYQKKFTFKAYDERNFLGTQFCDYRQGLVCKPLSKKCRCPEGSSMQKISGSSPAQRCLLDQDEICALVDIDHGHDRKHSSLARNLHHMIFNLEKPPSCKDGTQCRFKTSNTRTPLCYEMNSGPWYPSPNSGTLVTSFGQECVIGLYADVGSCDEQKLNFRRNVCYNFGPPRSLKMTNPEAESRTGFCLSEWGIFDITPSAGFQNPRYYRPFFIAFVHPRTVPLRGDELIDYYEKYRKRVAQHFAFDGDFLVEEEKEGERCTVSKTRVMEDAWRYFSSLEDDPPSGQDYVLQATKAELEAELQKVIDLAKNTAQKVCKIYWHFDRRFVQPNHEALSCVADGTTDADGNDGTCQLAGDETKPFAQKIKSFSDITPEIEKDTNSEETRYREDILLENPELPCLPSLGPLPPPQARHHNPDNLEGGLCPDGAVCYEDFSDSHDLYDVNCNLKDGAIQHLNCHDVSKPLEKCEKLFLDKKVTQALMDLDVHGGLGKGEACHYQFERTLRQNDASPIARIPAYQLLHWLERGILCDQAGQNLECTMAGTCECIGGRCKKPTTRRPSRGGSDRVSCSAYRIQLLLIITYTLTILK